MKTAEARSQAPGRTLRAGDAGLAPAGGHVVLARQGGEGLQGALHHVQVQRGHPELQRRHQSPHLRLCSRRTSLPRALPYIVEQPRKAMLLRPMHCHGRWRLIDSLWGAIKCRIGIHSP